MHDQFEHIMPEDPHIMAGREVEFASPAVFDAMNKSKQH